MAELMYDEQVYLAYATKKFENDNEIIIVDCGMNLGTFTDKVLEIFPDKKSLKVYGFEPLPALIPALVAKYSDEKRAYIVERAVGDIDGTADITYCVDGPECSSFFYRKKFQGELIKVDTITLDTFFDTNQQISYLKLDIEGGEMNALAGATNLIKEKRIRFIQFEVGDVSNSIGFTINSFIRFLSPHYNVYNDRMEILPIDYDEPYVDIKNFLAELK